MSEKIKALEKFLSKDQISQKEETLKIYGADWLGLYPPAPLAVLFPRTDQNVEDIIKWALHFHCPLVPSGGRTGLSGSASAQNQEIILSFEKMNQVIEFNEIEQSLRLQPGVITQRVQELAKEKSLYFPISFASEGSSQIGGNTATNAGGVHVIQYGILRKWILGLKVITGEGKKLYLGRGLIKNTAGLDLMNLFIGSEGTLGLITEITLQLTKPPKPSCVLLCSIPDLEGLMGLYTLFKNKISLKAFEMFTHSALEYVQKAQSLSSFALKDSAKYYALLEYPKDEQDTALTLLESAMENHYVSDGAASENDRQAKELWSFRENISESLSPYSPYKNDISVRISFLPKFLSEMNNLLKKEYPNFTVVWFGHIGDGNLHINILKPDNMEQKEFVTKCSEVNKLLFSVIQKYEGSISAEHGVGLLKKPYLHYSCSTQEIQYMKAVKKIFDPKNILNPGKIF